MKNLITKILISVVLMIAVFFAIKYFTNENLSETNGSIHLLIENGDGLVMFDDDLSFYEGDSFYDVLDRNFDLTCANGSYQADESCTYEFQSFGFQGKIILGIKNENFEIISDWTNSFLSIEKYDGQTYRLSTLGVSNLEFKDQDQFKISLKNVWE
jgi:hypothetical protein